MLAQSLPYIPKASPDMRPLHGWLGNPALQSYVMQVLGDPSITMLGLLVLWARLFLDCRRDGDKRVRVADLEPVWVSDGRLTVAGLAGVDQDPAMPSPLFGDRWVMEHDQSAVVMTLTYCEKTCCRMHIQALGAGYVELRNPILAASPSDPIGIHAHAVLRIG
jgi:hypothetical protein